MYIWRFFCAGVLLSLIVAIDSYSQVIVTVPSTTGGVLVQPEYLTIGNYGELYVPDYFKYKIFEIDSLGVLSTFAGTGVAGFSGDGGPATAAKINGVTSLCIDIAGNLYLSDLLNNRIRRVDHSSGIIETVAGTDSAGFWGDGGPASLAILSHPGGLCIDKNGNIYFSDSYGHRIRKIDTMGLISTVAGNGTIGTNGNGGPAILAAIRATFNTAIDSAGRLFFGDNGNNTVRVISTDGVITTFAGDTTDSTSFVADDVPALGAPMSPEGVAFDKNWNLVISDTHNDRVRKIDSLGVIHTIAGNGHYVYSGDDGPPDSAGIPFPGGVAFDKCGNMYVGQIGNPCIRKVVYDSICIYWSAQLPRTSIGQTTLAPNPATTHLTITTPTPIQTLTVSNYLGQAVLRREGSGREVDVSGLPAGVYVVEVVTENGHREYGKFVKE
jgi:sugar lactone lactonase YvrE